MRVTWGIVYQSRSSMNGSECSDSNCNFHSQELKKTRSIFGSFMNRSTKDK